VKFEYVSRPVNLVLPNIDQLRVIGNPALLNMAQIALFCSIKCPAAIILKTYDLAQQLKDKNIGVISGFHSPVEKEVLITLLRGDGPVIVCPARSIETMRIPAGWKSHIERNRMLIASPFAEGRKRPTQQTAALRNQLVAALAQQVFVAYAAPGGKTEIFSQELLAAGKNIVTFDSEQTRNLLDTGAKVINLTTTT